MQRLEGTRDFPVPLVQVWEKLSDVRFLTRCVPDVAEVKEATETKASLVIRPGFSFVRGELQLTLEKIDETPPLIARVRAKSKGVGSTSEVEAAFCLEERPNGTRLHWSAEVQQLGGLLKAVPQGLIQGGAQRVIEDLVKGIERNLAAQSLLNGTDS
jgi:carbon monoxide dehydrogenase subunit G